MVRSVINLRGIDPGFDSANVLLIDLDVTSTGRTGNQLIAFEHSLHERLNALHGVRSASLSWISLFGGSDLGFGVGVYGDTPPSVSEPVGRGSMSYPPAISKRSA